MATEHIDIPSYDHGERSATALEAIAQNLNFIAGSNASQLLTGWDEIGNICTAGTASGFFNIGDLIHEPWTDTTSGTAYDNPWRVNHFSDETDANAATIHGMWIQTKYAHPFGVQFSHQRAFLACPEGLSAGTYHFTIGESWGSNAVKDKVYKFTLTKDVANGGRLAGCYGMPDQSPSNWKVYSYDNDATTIIETVAVTEGSEGTDLGTMAFATRTGNLNSMQETAYGWNRWKTSALRQYLNSDKKKGQWWTPQDQWDIAPDQLASKDGFLCGIPDEMLRNIATVKVSTLANTVQDGGGTDVTYDKIILPSLSQMYITPQADGEEDAQKYWSTLNGTSTKWERYQTYPILKTYVVTDHTSPQSVRLRSAHRDDAVSSWYVSSSGNVNNDGASNADTFAPLAFIHR